MKASFKERGQAKLDRLDQDETQKRCAASTATKAPPKDVAEKIEKANLATIKWPADGKYLGDWKRGEQIAQRGRGLQWSDDPKGTPVGANCYACHQLAPAEIRYGTIGPSLYHFGKLRGYTTRCASTRTARSTTREAYIGVLEHAALRPQRHPRPSSRSRTSSRC